MNGKQLKNSILQWAIQGKLVPQDPNDEPASVLLERIREEKARLVKEKKIKKDKNESIIFRGDDNSHYEKFADGTVKCIHDEIPFEIPAGWAWCKIKHICTMQAGKNISASKIFAEYSELHPYRCVGGNGLRGYTESYNTSGHYSIVGRQGALCGCLNIENGDFYATEHAVVVDAYDIVPTTFIYYFLTALNLNQYATATAQPGLAVSNIIEVMFPLPPIQEQQRIVEQIKLIMPLVNKYEQSRSKLDSLNKTIYTQLKKSILQEAIQGRLVPQDSNDESASVLLERIREEKQRLLKEGKLKKKDIADSFIFKGDDNKYYEKIGNETVCIDEEIPFDIPHSWSWTRLASIVRFNPKNQASDNTAAAFIPMEQIESTYFSHYHYSIRKWGDIRTGFTHFADGDVAIAKITPCFQNRKSMILKDLPNGIGAGTTELKVLRPFSNTLDREYLLFFLESSYFVDEAIFKGTANQQRIITRYLENKLFPLPPFIEQQRICARIKDSFELLR